MKNPTSLSTNEVAAVQKVQESSNGINVDAFVKRYGQRVLAILVGIGIVSVTGCKPDEDPNQAPRFNDFPTHLAVQEGQPVGSVLTTVNATDPDGDPVTYSMGANEYFSIDDQGQITWTQQVDIDSPQEVSVPVYATDGVVPESTTEDLFVTINPNNDTIPPVPAVNGPTSGSLPENQTGIVGTFTGNVPGTWSLQNESTVGIFQLTNTGSQQTQLILAVEQNHEVPPNTHTVDVIFSPTSGGDDIVSPFSLSETDVPEPWQAVLSPQEAMNLGYDIDEGTLGGTFPFMNNQNQSEHFWEVHAQYADEGETTPSSTILKSKLTGATDADLLSQLQNQNGYNGSVGNLIDVMVYYSGNQIENVYDPVLEFWVVRSLVTNQQVSVSNIARAIGVIAAKVGADQQTTYTGTSPFYGTGDLGLSLHILSDMITYGQIETKLHLMAEGVAQQNIDSLHQ